MTNRTETVIGSMHLCDAVAEAIYHRQAMNKTCCVVILHDEDFHKFEHLALSSAWIVPNGIMNMEGMKIIKFRGVDVMPSPRVEQGIIYSY
jgi:hypothetical protein